MAYPIGKKIEREAKSDIVDVGLDLLEVLQYGQIAVAVGALVILFRAMIA